jgi:hypothetical protein
VLGRGVEADRAAREGASPGEEDEHGKQRGAEDDARAEGAEDSDAEGECEGQADEQWSSRVVEVAADQEAAREVGRGAGGEHDTHGGRRGSIRLDEQRAAEHERAAPGGERQQLTERPRRHGRLTPDVPPTRP